MLSTPMHLCSGGTSGREPTARNANDLSLIYNLVGSWERQMLPRKTAILLLMLSSLASQPLSAQDDAVISGDVTEIDLTSGTITIHHDANQKLKLANATDTFRVNEPIMLNAIRPGAHIRFAADRINGELAIVKIFSD
jgi:Cu/Ag efflux protein CusF